MASPIINNNEESFDNIDDVSNLAGFANLSLLL
jgi:hypothetical protein